MDSHSQGRRTAFRAFPACEHKAQDSLITCIGVDREGRTLYLGLSTGLLEEHKVDLVNRGRGSANSSPGVASSVSARKSLGKKACPILLHTFWFVLLYSGSQWPSVFAARHCSLSLARLWPVGRRVRRRAHAARL